MSKFLKEFREFAERGNAIDMAIGIIVGSVLTSVVNSLVADVIMPPIGLLIGGIDFSQFFIVLSGGAGQSFNTLAEAQAAGAKTMNIGLFLNTLVSFVITMFAAFLIVRTVNKMKSKKAVTTRACPYCKQSISKAATKCPFCCSSVKPEKIEAAGETDLQKGLKSLTNRVKGVAKAAKKVAKI